MQVNSGVTGGQLDSRRDNLLYPYQSRLQYYQGVRILAASEDARHKELE